MKFGLFTSLTGINWPQLQDLWRHSEDTGWDTACVTDHFMPNTPNPVDEALECWTALAGLALITTRMRIGTLVVAVPNRDNPVFRTAYRLARRKPLQLYHPDDREQHLHHWNPASLAMALEVAGFDLLSIVPDPCTTELAKGIVDRVGRIHSWLAGQPRTSAMVALAAPSRETW